MLKLKFCGKTELFGVPLQANISYPFQKEGTYIRTPDTDHTKIENVAGWNIAKLIPLDASLIKKAPHRQDRKVAEDIAKNNIDYLARTAQLVLDNYSQHKYAYGMVDINEAMRRLKNVLSESNQMSDKVINQNHMKQAIPKTAYEDLSSASKSDLSGYVGKESAAVISKETQQDLHTTQSKSQPQQVRQDGQARKSQNNVKQKAKAPNSAGKR